ncbi:MAG: SIR2 family NAD-dependent protein deacylase [Desulfosudaceae bacterium]
MMTVIDEVAGWIKESKKITGFTGAGISTGSGIPDFRSPDGVWARNRTVMFDDFLANQADRVEYWRQKLESWPPIRDARPNAGHRFFCGLEEAGRLLGVITQNIDGLHEKSGLNPDRIVRLHGWMNEAVCLSCGQALDMEEACRRVKEESPAPSCGFCGGLLKPATISFGQQLNQADLERAASLAVKSDLFVVVGSSLVVQPAAGFPMLAVKNGARLVIINQTATPLDKQADAVIHDDSSQVLQAIGDLIF